MKIRKNKQKPAQDVFVQRAQNIQNEIFLKIRTERQNFAREICNKIYPRMSAEKKLKLAFDFMNVGSELGLPEGTEIPPSYLRFWLKCIYKKILILNFDLSF
ncbi:MAG: hypothetical protein HYW88_01925 [Candidatus Sungbacteria bacterium]|nr:hypothetical protein [Candidatus Sungbacteria bacterium]